MDLKFIGSVVVAAAVAFCSIVAIKIEYRRLVGDAENNEPGVYRHPHEKVEAIILNSKTTIPRKDGEGNIEIWSVGSSSKGVALRMQYAESDPIIKCAAIIVPKSYETTRVRLDCRDKEASDRPVDRSEELNRVMFEEHVDAILKNRSFSRARTDAATRAIMFRNLGEMQREALEAQAADYEERRKMNR
ncbi:MAG: hypothetical protein ACAH20_15705 [Methylobacteriaceae bacterium]